MLEEDGEEKRGEERVPKLDLKNNEAKKKRFLKLPKRCENISQNLLKLSDIQAGYCIVYCGWIKNVKFCFQILFFKIMP